MRFDLFFLMSTIGFIALSNDVVALEISEDCMEIFNSIEKDGSSVKEVRDTLKLYECPSYKKINRQAKKEKAEKERISEIEKKKKAEIARIAKEKKDSEQLALAKSKGFNSYVEYKRAEEKRRELEELQIELKGKTFKAVLGCKNTLGGYVPVLFCLESAKVNGRFKFGNSFELQQKYDVRSNYLIIGLERFFELEVTASKGAPFFYVKIVDISTGEEVGYKEEKGNKYYIKSIKFKNG